MSATKKFVMLDVELPNEDSYAALQRNLKLYGSTLLNKVPPHSSRSLQS